VPTREDCVVEGVAIKAVPKASTRLRRMLWTTWLVYRRALREKADIYHFHDPELIPYALALQGFTNADVICDLHENVPEQILTKSYIPRVLRKWVAGAYDLLEQYCARKFSAIVTANEDINERFADTNARVIAVHNYADDTQFRRALEGDDSRYDSGLVFHCNASDRTAFPAVLRAFVSMSSDTAAKLVLTRATPSVAQLVGQSPGRRIELVNATREQLADLYWKCAVSVVADY